jgi:hypothetical protein
MQRSERSSTTRARVLAPRQRKTAEPDLFSITGWRGKGLSGGAAPMMQSRDRCRLDADLYRAVFHWLLRATG